MDDILQRNHFLSFDINQFIMLFVVSLSIWKCFATINIWFVVICSWSRCKCDFDCILCNEAAARAHYLSPLHLQFAKKPIIKYEQNNMFSFCQLLLQHNRICGESQSQSQNQSQPSVALLDVV